MSKNTRGQKEFSKEQELKHENQKLRNKIRELEAELRQLTRSHARTRKNLAKLDLDRHSYVQEIIQEHYADNDDSFSNEKLLNDLKKEWACFECGVGYLEIYLYTRMDGTFYYRHCNHCDHRTSSQKYDENKVKGIIKPTEITKK